MADEMQMAFGSTTTVISHAGTLADGANTYDGGSTTMVELDNSTTLYPYARAVFENLDSWGGTPSGNVELHMRKHEVDAASDDELPVPSGSADLKGAHYVGFFEIDDSAAAANRVEIVIGLAGVTKAHFYIKNDTGQTASYTDDPITVKVTPFSHKPSA